MSDLEILHKHVSSAIKYLNFNGKVFENHKEYLYENNLKIVLSNMPNSHIFLEKITEVHNYEECLHKILYETKNNLKENEQTNNFPYEIVNNCLIPYIATVNRRKHRFN